jgi:hypothetical protein
VAVSYLILIARARRPRDAASPRFAQSGAATAPRSLGRASARARARQHTHPRNPAFGHTGASVRAVRAALERSPLTNLSTWTSAVNPVSFRNPPRHAPLNVQSTAARRSVQRPPGVGWVGGGARVGRDPSAGGGSAERLSLLVSQPAEGGARPGDPRQFWVGRGIFVPCRLVGNSRRDAGNV